MDVSIVIVNYNTYDLLIDSINSIRRFTPDTISYEIIVVNNNFVPAEIEKLKTISGIELILSDKNLGFGAGNNLGVQHAKGKFLLLLNSDNIFVEDALTSFIFEYNKLKESHKVGVLGAQLMDRNFESASSYYSFPKLSDVAFDRYRHLFKYRKASAAKHPEQQTDDRAADGTVDYIIGADMFLKKVTYDAQHGFDEKFFMYFEEADLQLRLAKDGYRHFFTPNIRIIHLEGGSYKKASEESNHVPNGRRIMIHVSRNLYFRKHLSRWQYFGYMFSEISLVPLRILSPNHSLKENFTFVKKCISSL